MPCDSAQPELGKALLVSHGWLSRLDKYRRLPEDWSIEGSQWRASVGVDCMLIASLIAGRWSPSSGGRSGSRWCSADWMLIAC
jgi:hypothetical protein